MATHSWLGVPGVVLPVIEQRGEICWAIVGGECISSQYKALHPDEDHQQLSTQEILNCVKNWYFNREVTDEEKDDKFSFTRVFLYAGARGICLDRDYVLDREDKECNPPHHTKRFFVKDYVSPKTEDEVKEALSRFPIAGAVRVYNSFKYYTGGIYAPTLEEQNDPKLCSGTHAILLTGFCVEDGVEVYEFKNSWGITWGQEGIGKIRKDLVFCISYPSEIFWIQKSKKFMASDISKVERKDGDGPDNSRGGTSDKKLKGNIFDRRGKKGINTESSKSNNKKKRGGKRTHRSDYYHPPDCTRSFEMIEDGQAGKPNPCSTGGDDKDSLGSPAQKKQKLNEESDGTEEEEGEEDEVLISDDDSDDSNKVFKLSDEQWAKLKLDYCPEGVEEVDVDVWSKYLREIKESEGFDIYHYPGLCLMAQFHPLNVGNSSIILKYLIDHSNAAIDVFNREKLTNYKLETLEKANSQLWDIGVNYYITFQAKDSVANAINTFQALVWSGPKSCNSESPIVNFCRLKPAAAAS